MRKLFCEISPFTYKISTYKERALHYLRNFPAKERFAASFAAPLPIIVHRHKSLIRRRLGNVDLRLQDNKAINLSIAAPKISGVLIHPGETFSFWKLVGSCTKAKGYKEGLTITGTAATKGIGGGMCQLSNLLHWLVLHSPLEITEHHHHDNFDLFPDFKRQVPFGVGTSILYNYIDYRVQNNTAQTFQFIVCTSDEYLHGELRSSEALAQSYHIRKEDEYFYEKDGQFFRHNKVYRVIVDTRSGDTLSKKLIQECNALVLYDSAQINKDLLRSSDE
ncbi:MAG: VanW family protein [Oscillospiraceae bacterium]|nr:VanW family protein [Oscillospiraceae bacterium]